ncbi:hypothetical protein AB6A40_006910 [Gnathostoma spinigerum]|uniref:Uncharacterized protein n=1 Tax=Gnathostoma spinigerum TaxID=75299 RepID=A0ABD6ERX0_9BILA
MSAITIVVMRSLAFGILLYFGTFRIDGHAITTEETHEDQETLGHELKKFYGQLNTEEKAALTEVAKKLNSGQTQFSLQENSGFFDDVKQQSTGLFDKLINLKNFVNSKLEHLQPGSRAFIEQVLYKFVSLFGEDSFYGVLMRLKGFGKEIVYMYDGLSRDVREDVAKEFPTITSIATSDIVRVLFNYLSNFNLGEDTSTPRTPSRPEPSHPIPAQDNIDHRKGGGPRTTPAGSAHIYPTLPARPTTESPTDDIGEAVAVKQVTLEE